jgi:hypothetical protein
MDLRDQRLFLGRLFTQAALAELDGWSKKKKKKKFERPPDDRQLASYSFLLFYFLTFNGCWTFKQHADPLLRARVSR